MGPEDLRARKYRDIVNSLSERIGNAKESFPGQLRMADDNVRVKIRDLLGATKINSSR